MSVLNFVLAGIALYANNFFANQRERRKETRSKLDEIIKQIESIQALAIDYHTGNSYSETKRDTLIISLSRLQTSIGRVVFFRQDTILVGKVVKFKQAISSRNFENAEFHSQSHNSEIVLDMLNSKESLHSQLESAYESVFPVEVNSTLAKFLGR